MNEKSKVYKFSFFIGQSIVVIFAVLILLGIVFLLYNFITSLYPFFFNRMQQLTYFFKNTFFNSDWLNNNQGILSLISIIIAILPFLIQIITLQQLWKWRGEYNKKVEKVSGSIMISAMNLFRNRIDLKKYIEKYEKNEVVVRPKIFRTYPIEYGIKNNLEEENKNYFTVKINLLVILEYLDIINQQQSLLIHDRDNEYVRTQIINDMKYTLEKVNQTLPLMEKEIQKYEYQIKNWTFSKDPTFLSVFSIDELKTNELN